jgi:capsular exopolysaccharide synthesis family protein
MKVLIIDFEFRKKRNELLFENEKTMNASTERLIKDTIYKNLKYLSLASKFPNPESFIDSAQLKNFIDDLSRSFDKVIIDTPPLEGVIDSALIAANTNVTLFVIESKRHDYRKVLQIKEQLEKAGARILGVVLCKADKSSLKSFFEYQKYCKKNKLNKALEIEQYIAV